MRKKGHMKVRWRSSPDRIIQNQHRIAMRGLQMFVIHLENELVNILSTGGDKNHRSPPWGPPYTQKGHLKRSIGHEKVGENAWAVGTGIGGKRSPGYAFFLEYGTAKMLPRPFFRPTIWKEKHKMAEFVETSAWMK